MSYLAIGKYQDRFDTSQSIDNKDLVDITKDLQSTLEKTYFLFTKFLILHFPNNLFDSLDKLPIKSPELKKWIFQISTAYDTLTTSVIKQLPYSSSDHVGFLFKNANFLNLQLDEFIKQETKENAFRYHSLTYTFPEHYHIELQAGCEEAKLFDCIDREGLEGCNDEVLYQLGSLFFKQYALCKNGQFLTFFDLAKQWVQEGGSKNKLIRFKNRLFFHWLVDCDLEIKEKKHLLNFEDYTYHKTFDALQSALQIEHVIPKIKALFFKKMTNSRFRRDLIFYTWCKSCNPSQEINPWITKEAMQWITALIRYPYFVKKWHIPIKWFPIFFNWLAETSNLPKEVEEADLSPILSHIAQQPKEKIFGLLLTNAKSSITKIKKEHPVIEEFLNDTKIMTFNDSSLEQLAHLHKMELVKMGQIIAHFLLKFFKTHSEFNIESPLLKKIYHEMGWLYSKAIQTLFERKDLDQDAIFKNLQDKYYPGGDLGLIQYEATKVDETLITFSDHLLKVDPPDHRKAESIYAFVRQPNLNPPRGAVADMAMFAYKHIALILKNKRYNFWEALYLWGDHGGSSKIVEQICSCFRGQHLLKKPSIKRQEQTLDFQDFIIEKTISEYERMFGLKLDSSVRAFLEEKCRDESFRLKLVFLTHYFEVFQDNDDSVLQWCKEVTPKVWDFITTLKRSRKLAYSDSQKDCSYHLNQLSESDACKILKDECEHAFVSDLSKFHRELIGDVFLDEETLLLAVKLDLSPEFVVVLPSGKTAKSHEEIREIFQDVRFMAFLQQGLYGKVQKEIRRYFGFSNNYAIFSPYTLSNKGKLIDTLTIPKQVIKICKIDDEFAIKAYAYCEIKKIDSNTPIALIKVEIVTNPKENKIYTTWKIERVGDLSY